MNNLSLEKYKENFFRKCFNKIRNFFFRKDEIQTEEISENIEEIHNLKPRGNSLDSLNNGIKFDNTKIKQKEFIKNLIDNPDLFEDLSTDRLEVVLEYILEENNRKKNLLAKLD